jgi:thiosulfate/3-mercaptopyruvate sulfurtransferase
MDGDGRPEMLVETDWVAQNLGRPSLRLVEVDLDTNAYEQGHIPGAVGWSWQTDAQDRLCRDILSPEAFAALMGRSGIGNDTTVVLYGDNNNWFAAYALWMLKYYGHKDVHLMNGGRRKWLEEGRGVSAEPPGVEPCSYTLAPVEEELWPLDREGQREGDANHEVGAGFQPSQPISCWKIRRATARDVA